MRFAPFILILPLFTGCTVYYPHTTLRASAISGTVVDASTRAPIAGAKVFRTQHPEKMCYSDSAGRFKLKELRNWHYGVACDFGGGDDVPPGEHWFDRIVTVFHTNYSPYTIDLATNHGGTIFLNKPGEDKEQTHLWLLFNGKGAILNDMGAAGYLKPGDIRIVERLKTNVEDRPCRLRIGFVQRVYNPWVTAIGQPDKPQLTPATEKGFVWEFNVWYHLWEEGAYLEDSSRVYRLEFIP